MKLREVKIVSDLKDGRTQKDHGITSGAIEVVFFAHASRLIELILQHQFAFGCVAWLTDPQILAALAQRVAQIVIQKEDFLRPDTSPRAGWRTELRRSYDQIRCWFDRYELPSVAGSLSTNGDSTCEGIRCVGERPHNRNTSPKMHHKFLVLGSIKDEDNDKRLPPTFSPEVVWTGSFNFTRNASASFENAVIIRDTKIADAYLKEWAQILALSEPLDWTSEYIAPEWRIGT